MALQGLDFSPGLAFQLKLWHALSMPVSCSSSPRSFFLVVSFGRCKFRLCTASVGLLLQATVGGSAAEFCVFALGDRVFCFSVSSNQVGHFIFKLRSFECSLYKLHFHLWNNGGPKWQLEWKKFRSEEENSWQPAQKNKTSTTFSEFEFPSPGNQNRTSGFERLEFPSMSNRAPSVLRLEFPSMSNRVPSVLHPATSVLGPFPGLSQTDSWDQSHSLISNFGQRSRPESAYPSLMTSSRICSRCLTNAHELRFCRAPIKCHACLHWGHIMVSYPVRRQGGSKPDVVTMPANGKAILEQPNTFNAPHGPGPSEPPVLESFAHWAASHLQLAGIPITQVTVPWNLPQKSMTSGPVVMGTHLTVNEQDLEQGSPNLQLSLAPSASGSPLLISSGSTVRQENLAHLHCRCLLSATAHRHLHRWPSSMLILHHSSLTECIFSMWTIESSWYEQWWAPGQFQETKSGPLQRSSLFRVLFLTSRMSEQC